ncbi:MAG: sigma 54-interacting transcriptional regulator [Bryobacterales bacterium]
MAAARIMVVEDEQITAADIDDMLTALGYSVIAAVASGEEALRKAAEDPPDLVLMDIRLKGKCDGIETALQLRQRFDIPVIYLTAHADQETLNRAKLAEPLGYLVKPFQEADLQASLQMALYKHEVDRVARRKEEWLASTLSAIGEGVLCAGSTGLLTFINPSAEEWTGWKAGEALGQGVTDVFRVMDRQSRQPSDMLILRALRDARLVEIPDGSVLLARNGMERAISGNIAPIHDHLGRVSGAVVAFGPARGDAPAAPAIHPERHRREQIRTTRLIAESPPMQEVVKFAQRIARSGVTTIMLQGESGTGKDLFARFLHETSPRAESPFVAINCAAIPETLLESELFGYEKGAFTDARALKKGVLELADGGTIFLDEIGELPFHLQAKLLRVLEDQSFRRLGGVRDVTVDVRVISATNKNLGEAVRAREFRQDLFYRLNVIQIALPPLREHQEDIVPLVDHFIDFYNRKFESGIEGATVDAMRKLQAYDWPGNIRELRNVIERAMVLEDQKRLTADNLALGEGAGSPFAAPSPSPSRAEMSLEETEKSMLAEALQKTAGNQTQAARLLGISRDTLRYRIKKFDLK